MFIGILYRLRPAILSSTWMSIWLCQPRSWMQRRRTIEAADVLIAQVTATKAWLDVSAFDTAAVTLLVPVVGAGLFWPFAGQPHPKSLSMAYRPYGAEHSDAYLNKLISRGVPP